MAAKKSAKKEPAADKAEKPQVAHAPAEPAAPRQSKQTKPAAAHSANSVIGQDKVMAHLKLHGKEFVGTVISDKANKTVTVEWERRTLVKKYERYERRFSRVYAHNPITINARHGDTVRIKETRPLSKTKNFVVTEVVKRASPTEAVQ
jgi:small subunit ribosomal protein S17